MFWPVAEFHQHALASWFKIQAWITKDTYHKRYNQRTLLGSLKRIHLTIKCQNLWEKKSYLKSSGMLKYMEIAAWIKANILQTCHSSWIFQNSRITNHIIAFCFSFLDVLLMFLQKISDFSFFQNQASAVVIIIYQEY